MSCQIRRPLFWLLVFTFFHGVLYAALAHPWQAPDEYLHYEYLRLIDAKRSLTLSAEDRSSAMQWEVADTMRLFQHNRFRLLPTLPEAEFRAIATPLGSKNFTPQPPLYYLLSLPIYWGLRSQPVLTQLYALRMFSVALHVLTVWLTYLLATRIFIAPGSELKRLAAAAWVALWPSYTFISASYNNDNLAPPLVAATLLVLVVGLQRRGDLRLWFAGAFLCLLAALTKRTAWAMLPVLVLALILSAGLLLRSARPRGKAAGGLLLLLGAGVLAALVLPLLFPFRIPGDIARMLRLDPEALLRLSAFLGELPPVDWGWWFTFMLDSFSVQ
ncbi:MAG: glycosyltransferase family 39 protein, partial [Chloroflexi bacterium]|nr:glycosyltransferase family 39 protein [Chloroflexota bacterium]